MTATTLDLVPYPADDAAPLDEGLALVQNATAVLYNGLGRYAEALEAAEQACSGIDDAAVDVLVLPELVEAASRSGQGARAAEALARLTAQAQLVRSDWALGVATRSRALLTDGPGADPLYREAIGRLTRSGLPLALGRTHLLYGEWLRRAGRRVDARMHLRTAVRILDGLGVDAFTERARSELVATGATVRKRGAEHRDELTAHERQIAARAADGQTNPEIASALFLSPRTVEWHLRKVFFKLGIASRKELRTVLPVAAHA